jgi:hypothetical protein
MTAGLAAIVGLVIAVGLTAQPHRLDPEQAIMRDAASWIRGLGYPADQISSTHVWFYHYFPLPVRPGRTWSRPPNPDALPAGSIVVWDAHYSEPWGLRRLALEAPGSHWTKLREYEGARVQIYRKG